MTRTFRKARFYCSLTQTPAVGKWRVSLWLHRAFMWPDTTKNTTCTTRCRLQIFPLWPRVGNPAMSQTLLTFSLRWMRRMAVTWITLKSLLVSTYFWAAWQKMCRVSRLLLRRLARRCWRGIASLYLPFACNAALYIWLTWSKCLITFVARSGI